jgi:dihydropteroate synthase
VTRARRPPSRVLFVTGKLAEPALRRVLDGMQPPFAVEIAVMKITVAALMTPPWIAKFLTVPPGTDLILLPGLVEGDPELLRQQFEVEVARGPKDLRDLPEYFGAAARAPDYGAHDIAILAEINNAAKLSQAAILSQADYYRASGADVIDLGCTPGLAFPALADRVAALRAAGHVVSVDSMDPGEIGTAVAAGASWVLSVNGSNRDVVPDLAGSGTRVVVIPDSGAGLETLDPTIAVLERAGVGYLLDPILEPIGFGLLASLERYAEVGRRYPGVPQMMGIGNLTELTSADSTGVNAVLIAVAEEAGVRAVLTTEVIPWARGAVREIDIARRLMHYAVRQRALPKHVDDRLLTIKDPRVLRYSEAELRDLHQRVTDPNFRIFADAEAITIFNHQLFLRGTDIQQLFDELGVEDPGHAFYLGKELARARLALDLGKTYRQEGQLDWGYLTPSDDPRREHFKPSPRRPPPKGGPAPPSRNPKPSGKRAR